MDFKTKRKIVIMRRFNHTDLAMIAGASALLGSIAFMLITQGMGI